MTYFNALNDLSKQYDEVRLVLGDQLHAGHSWWQTPCSNILYVMFEMQQELDYVKHHRQKILAFFAAMRNFAKAISHKHDMLYIALDNSDNQQDLIANLKAVIHKVKATKLTYQEPDEYRLNQQLAGIDWIERECVGSEHFFTQRNNLKRYFPKQKSLLMETFYRQLRQDTGYLMNGNKPMGDRWNFDSENRKKLPKNHSLPTPLCFANDVADIEEMLTKQKVDDVRKVERYRLSVNRHKKAIELLRIISLSTFFLTLATFQDAMTESGWSALNSFKKFRLALHTVKILLCLNYVIERAIERYKADFRARLRCPHTLRALSSATIFLSCWRDYRFDSFIGILHLPDRTGSTKRTCAPRRLYLSFFLERQKQKLAMCFRMAIQLIS